MINYVWFSFDVLLAIHDLQMFCISHSWLIVTGQVNALGTYYLSKKPIYFFASGYTPITFNASIRSDLQNIIYVIYICIVKYDINNISHSWLIVSGQVNALGTEL